VETGNKDWMQRVDAENPALHLQRHVHVARSKHINTKNMQVAWNQDGTKHDSKSFNSKIGALNAVQSIAQQALGLSDKVKLEEAIEKNNNLINLNESIEVGYIPVLFKLKQQA